MNKDRLVALSLLTLLCVALYVVSPASRGRRPFSPGPVGAYDAPDEATQYFLNKRLPPGATELPSERYAAANAMMQKLPIYSTAVNGFLASSSPSGLSAWTQLGPGNVGGRTRALLADPDHPNTMFAGGVAGGIWKTTDGGASWTPKTDLVANVAVSCLAVGTEAAPAVKTLYAGTGELFAADGVRGLGIYTSTDNGETWSLLSATDTPDFFNVCKIVISPSNPRLVYAATQTGLWRGVKKLNVARYVWTLITPPNGTRVSSYDVAVRAGTAADTVIAVTPGKIYCSNFNGDAGTWFEAYSDPGAVRTTLAVARSNSNYVYAMSSGVDNSLASVARSTNGGQSFQDRVRGPFNMQNLNTYLLTNPYYGYHDTTHHDNRWNQGRYDNAIAVDPVNPNVVWAGGIDLFRSDDGGQNWGVASFYEVSDSHYAHSDHHVIVFPPGSDGNTMVVGNDGGIYKTTNAHAAVATDLNSVVNSYGSSVNWSNLNNGYGVTQFFHGLPYPSGNTYFGGTQDNGTIQGADGGPNAWSQILDSDGGFVAITPDGNVRYAEKQHGALYRSEGGSSFQPTEVPHEDIDLPFVTVFVMDPSNSQRLWLGGQSMWRSDDAANHWERAHMAATLDGSASVTAIAVAPGHPDIVFAGTTQGNIYRTSNGNSSTASTVTWTKTNCLRASAAFVTWIAFDPQNTNRVYVCYSTFNDQLTDRHIYKSEDGGATWDPNGLDGTTLPDVPVHCLTVDPSNSQRLFVGTDVGVFVSLDSGLSWARENTGFANVITDSLAIANVSGVPNLFAFTHGRGAWRVPLGVGGSAPLAPSNLTAAAVSSSEIDLRWQDNSNNELGFKIERSTDGSAFTQIATVGVNQTTYPSTGLAANTRYYYRVRAYNGPGDSGYSNVASTTTLVGQSPPSVPGNLAAAAPSSTQVTLSWQDSDTEDSYRIERKGGSSSQFQEIGSAGMNATGYTDNLNIQPATAYVYRVRACSATSGCSAYSNEAPVTTPGGGGGTNPCPAISFYSGSGLMGYAEGAGTGAMWNGPRDAAVGKHPVNGYKALFVADTDNQVIRLVYIEGPNAGRSEKIAGGVGAAGYKNNTNPDKVRYNSPMGIATAVNGSGVVTALVIADTGNHMVRKLLPPASGSTQWTSMDVAGVPGVPGNDATHLNAPQGVVVTPDGNIYVADTDNNLIRKISPQGTMTTLLGGAAYGMSTPSGITANQSGQLLYVVDPGNYSVWQVTLAGVPQRIAGGTPGSQDGVGLSAQFNKPYHLVWCNTASGEMLVIADRANHRLRRLAVASNTVTTFAGATSGDQVGDCMSARFASPRGVTAAGDGSIYILDTANHRIKKAL